MITARARLVKPMKHKMNLGLLLNGENLLLDDILQFSRLAEKSGAESLWTSELVRDAFTPLAAVASVTESVRLGTAVATFARPPMHTEIAAMTMAELTNENFVLGLGTAPPNWNSDWHGLTVHKPVQRMREYVTCIQKMWTASLEHPIDYPGTFVNVKNYGRFIDAPCTNIPIYLAAVQENMLRLAGEVGDGLLANMLNTPEYFSNIAHPNVEIGRRRVERPEENFEFATLKIYSVHKDRRRARELSKQAIAFYSTLPYFDIVLDPAGFSEQKEKIRAAYNRNNFSEMIRVVTEEMVDRLVLAGTPGEILKQIEPFQGLVDTMILACPNFGVPPEETKSILQTMMHVFSEY